VTDAAPALLEIEDLEVGFETEAGLLHAVDQVSLKIRPGTTVGLVGESGCGKSVTAAAVLRLVPIPPGKILGGKIKFAERGDLLSLPTEELSSVRGQEIAMIFQDPMTSLNPVFTVGKQLVEVLTIRFGMDRAGARARAVDMLRTVGIPDPEARLVAYPHELSGGMKQRVMIAMALLSEPRLLIADEPTTALDVTIQAQILHLIRELQSRTGAAVLFITHDMGVVAEMCDEVAVMYAGRLVERGGIFEIFEHSRHPYTRGLLRSVPGKGTKRKGELATIEGVVPSPLDLPSGCRFAPRCWKRELLGTDEQQRCFEEDPKLEPKDGGGVAACHFPITGTEQ
jgi:oligopeptide/dipeptide ABC transporter ATP-binding protein